MEFLLFAPFFILGIIVFFSLLGQSVHKSMVVGDGDCKNWDYGTFKDFMREFNSRKGWHNEGWSGSLFTPDRSGYLHAGIIRFGNKGMVLRTPSYIRYVLFMWSKRESTTKRRKDIWKVK